MDIPYDIVEENEIQHFDEGIYKREYIDELLEDDELSFEEAAFMTGYCDFT